MNTTKKMSGCITEILGGYDEDIVSGDKIILKKCNDAILIGTIPSIFNKSKFMTAFQVEEPHDYKIGDKVTYGDKGDKISNLVVVGKLNFIQKLLLSRSD